MILMINVTQPCADANHMHTPPLEWAIYATKKWKVEVKPDVTPCTPRELSKLEPYCLTEPWLEEIDPSGLSSALMGPADGFNQHMFTPSAPATAAGPGTGKEYRSAYCTAASYWPLLAEALGSAFLPWVTDSIPQSIFLQTYKHTVGTLEPSNGRACSGSSIGKVSRCGISVVSLYCTVCERHNSPAEMVSVLLANMHHM